MYPHDFQQGPTLGGCGAMRFSPGHSTQRHGLVVVMYVGDVSWESKKQPTAAVSTMHVEYQACAAAAR
jgi:hypothetical protein